MSPVQLGADDPSFGNALSAKFPSNVGEPLFQRAALSNAQRPPALPADSLARQPWTQLFDSPRPPSSQASVDVPNGSDPSGNQGGFVGIINRLIAQLGWLMNQAGNSGSAGSSTQAVNDGTFASTGDPHLSEHASLDSGYGNSSPIDRHFDSMTGHDNLLSSQEVDGGYRLSTTVTSPGSNGATMNAAASVHVNGDRDTITMRNDGSYSLTSDGNDVSVAVGQNVTLGGGEQVARNADGSLTVTDRTASGGSITTTLAAKAGGVDVTAAVHHLTVSGDIVDGAANANRSDPPNTLNPPNLMHFSDPQSGQQQFLT